jgi:4-alpha-glucanotransferase
MGRRARARDPVRPGRDRGPGTLVAEDLGVITADVEKLRTRSGPPGMRVLQFAFDGDPDNTHLPHHYTDLGVVYTGTHDNDTTVGWWHKLDDRTRDQVRSTSSTPTRRCPGR